MILDNPGPQNLKREHIHQNRPFTKLPFLIPVNFSQENRERKLNTIFFFSNFSGTSGISRQNPGISRQKSLVSLVSRDIPNFSAPTPSRGRPPPHRRISGLKSLGLGSFFFREKNSIQITVAVVNYYSGNELLSP